jgi:TonB family protein
MNNNLRPSRPSLSLALALLLLAPASLQAKSVALSPEVTQDLKIAVSRAKTVDAAMLAARDSIRKSHAAPISQDAFILLSDPLDESPVISDHSLPSYPLEPRRDGQDGAVVVLISVDETGNVTQARAVWSTSREFVQPSLEAVRTWTFAPGRRKGVAVPFQILIPLRFRLDNPAQA